MHPFAVRALGFPGHKQPIRERRGRARGRSLALLDRLGTVPALRFGSERVQTNRAHRALSRATCEPEPPLFPADAQRRRDVKQAEAWGDEVFQMAARRLGLTGSLNGLDNFRDRGNSGRLGALLSPSERCACSAARGVTATAFKANAQVEGQLVASCRRCSTGSTHGSPPACSAAQQLNAADFMIAPSLALIAYRLDLRAQIEARPAGACVERVLPEPPLPVLTPAPRSRRAARR